VATDPAGGMAVAAGSAEGRRTAMPPGAKEGVGRGAFRPQDPSLRSGTRGPYGP